MTSTTTTTAAAPVNPRAATHKGHCQACGWLQKLPKGVLAKHGYNVAHGFFSGTCAGSGHRPFEVAYDLVERFVAAAQTALDAVVASQAELRTAPTVARAWVHNYEPVGMTRRGMAHGYVWRKVDVLSETRTVGEHSWLNFHYLAPGTRGTGADQRHAIETGYDADRPLTALAVAAVENRRYADSKEIDAKRLRRYIAWQSERVRTWQPAPLVPVSVKRDGLGFDPEAK